MKLLVISIQQNADICFRHSGFNSRIGLWRGMRKTYGISSDILSFPFKGTDVFNWVEEVWFIIASYICPMIKFRVFSSKEPNCWIDKRVYGLKLLCISFLHNGINSWNVTSWSTRVYICFSANTMATDNLVAQAAGEFNHIAPSCLKTWYFEKKGSKSKFSKIVQ